MGHFDGHLFPGALVRGSEDGSHAAARCDFVEVVVVEGFAGFRLRHFVANRTSTEFVWPAAVHTHTFDTMDTDELNTDIVTAIALIGNRHQALCGGVQIFAVGDNVGDLGRG
jgi:hypothetical protein